MGGYALQDLWRICGIPLCAERRNYVEILSLQAKYFTHIVNRNLTHSMSLEETEFIWNLALNKTLFKLEEKHINIAE